MPSERNAKPPVAKHAQINPLSLGVAAAVSTKVGTTVTAREAGGLRDMALCVSPSKVPVAKALQNLAKAMNLALTHSFLETELDIVYKAARIHKGAVELLHEEYIGLGDGILASVGKVGKSIQLTLRGPDPASPAGEKAYKERGRARPVSGLFNLLGRKLDLLQEFEDQVPNYVEQMLDRLEGANMITDWDRHEWEIGTKVVGLDVVIRPKVKK
jgi:hypothetical protein